MVLKLAKHLVLVATIACAPPVTRTPAVTVVDTSGARTTFPNDLARSKLTVLLFYSDHCPCFRVHAERIRQLSRTYASQGVSFLLVDSEVGATLDRDRNAAQERDLPPIAIDPGARIAEAVGAEYATYTVVLDAKGQVRYRGGIDSDKNRLTDDRREYLRAALDALLAEREPPWKEGKALGCALQTR